MKNTALILIPLLMMAGLSSCEDCKECYLIEENSGAKTETYVGDRCDQEIDDLEKHSLVCLSDDCYYECR